MAWLSLMLVLNSLILESFQDQRRVEIITGEMFRGFREIRGKSPSVAGSPMLQEIEEGGLNREEKMMWTLRRVRQITPKFINLLCKNNNSP